MKILPYSLISPNFKAIHECNVEKLDNKGNNAKNFLVHDSRLFRYEADFATDEKTINYLRKQQNKAPLQIVSAGCSYGEEAYSYALALDGYGIESDISAFDLSELAIQNAKKGVYLLSVLESRYLFNSPSSDFKNTIRTSLDKNFDIKQGGCDVIYKKDGAFPNCNFFVGDVTKAKDYYDKNSKDVILCRYVLYHLKLHAVGETLSQFYDILKPGGLLVFSPCDYDVFEDMAINAGFKKTKISDCVFQKPYNVSSDLVVAMQNPIKP